ncbi:MAG: PEP-CTERM sorting domain-containing protein [candidate division Zixibacteria bacterium]|nr:PEP-CTERM sorting domain-containing protein [candidate division Zixibacteria bacterium]
MMDYTKGRGSNDADPEPATFAIFGLGLLGAGLISRKRSF